MTVAGQRNHYNVKLLKGYGFMENICANNRKPVVRDRYCKSILNCHVRCFLERILLKGGNSRYRILASRVREYHGRRDQEPTSLTPAFMLALWCFTTIGNCRRIYSLTGYFMNITCEEPYQNRHPCRDDTGR